MYFPFKKMGDLPSNRPVREKPGAAGSGIAAGVQLKIPMRA